MKTVFKLFLLIICVVVVVVGIVHICNVNTDVTEHEEQIVIEETQDIAEPIEETEVPTEPTEPATEPPTEPPTEEPTEPPTEVPEEWVYDDNLSAEENIFIYLTDYLGFSDAAACGIIANIAHETGWKFNPEAGRPSYCYGLIQWMGGRLSKLKSWCKENGKDYTSIQGQLDYMYWELNYNDPYNTYEKLLECEDSAEGAYDAAYDFCVWYERPANTKARARARGAEAREYYEELVLAKESVQE